MNRILRRVSALRRIRRIGRDEDGVALAAVLGFMAVGLVLTTVVAGTVVTGISQTSAARAGVQSQGSADAGIAAARAAIASGDCAGEASPVFTSADPAYTATVYRPDGAGGWSPGCPTALNSTDQVRIVSVGSAAAKGVQGVSHGDAATVEAILSPGGQYIPGSPAVPPTPATVPLVASGPAVYAYSSSGFGGSGSLSSVDGSTPGVLIKNGSVSCSGASNGVDNWSIANGGITLDGSCHADGDIFASGRATINGAGAIGGNVVSNGVTMSGSAHVGGSIWSTSDVQLPGSASVSGTVTATSLTMSGSASIAGGAWIYNDTFMDSSTRIGGQLTTKTKSGSGKQYGSLVLTPAGPGPSPYTTPSAPDVPGWVELPSNASWPGFTTKTISGDCGYDAFTALITSFNGAPAVTDARGGSGAVHISDYQSIALTNDTVIIAKQFDLGGSASFTGSGRLWLVNPDDTPDEQPTCAPGNSFSLGGAFSFASTLSVMIYSPCKVTLGSATNLKGQIYTGSAAIDGAAHLAFAPIGVPGWNLSTGGSNVIPGTPGHDAIPAQTIPITRSVVTYRNLAGAP